MVGLPINGLHLINWKVMAVIWVPNLTSVRVQTYGKRRELRSPMKIRYNKSDTCWAFINYFSVSTFPLILVISSAVQSKPMVLYFIIDLDIDCIRFWAGWLILFSWFIILNSERCRCCNYVVWFCQCLMPWWVMTYPGWAIFFNLDSHSRSKEICFSVIRGC